MINANVNVKQQISKHSPFTVVYGYKIKLKDNI